MINNDNIYELKYCNCHNNIIWFNNVMHNELLIKLKSNMTALIFNKLLPNLLIMNSILIQVKIYINEIKLREREKVLLLISLFIIIDSTKLFCY